MPQRHKWKHQDSVEDDVPWAAEWDVDVTDNPEIVAAMPAPPESEGRVIVRHASDHILRWVDAVQKCPGAEESPWN